MFYRGNYFCDFLFAILEEKNLPKPKYTVIGRDFLWRSNSFLLTLPRFKKGRKTDNDMAVSL